MHCSNCGTKINDNTKFCQNCGVKNEFISDGDVVLKKKEKLGAPFVIVISGILIACSIWGISLGVNAYHANKAKQQAVQQAALDAIAATNAADQATSQKEISDLTQQVTQLQNKPATVIISDSLSSAAIQKWKNRSVYAVCTFVGDDYTATGSGLIEQINYNGADNSPVVITNKHVVTDAQGYSADYCDFYMYGGHSYHEPYTDFGLGSNGDYAYIPLPSDSYTSSIGSEATCTNAEASLNDKITIFGYPADGSNSGVTITDGVISGDEGDYYVTDAKIDHGNSGGIAVLNKDDCYLGIPTWAETGSIESFGRILKSTLVLN